MRTRLQSVLPRSVLAAAWDALSATPEQFYDERDWPTVRRFGIALWMLGAVLTALLLPFAPPVHAVGRLGGWLTTVTVLLVTVFLIRRLVARPAILREELLAGSIFAVAGLALLAWLSHSELYVELLLLPTVYSAMAHPPRRAAIVLAVAIGASVPLVGVDTSDMNATELTSRAILWASLMALAIGWSSTVRRERGNLLQANEAEHVRAFSDPLTGLGNRRAFDEALRVELARAERSGGSFVLLSMDLEDFKRVNDVHGHLAGDSVLRSAAHVLVQESRPPDTWFRWGGDEFTGLYPDTTDAEASAIIERMVGALAARCRRPDGRPLHAQIGFAHWRPELTGDDLLATADAQVLAAKHERGLQRYDSRTGQAPLSAS